MFRTRIAPAKYLQGHHASLSWFDLPAFIRAGPTASTNNSWNFTKGALCDRFRTGFIPHTNGRRILRSRDVPPVLGSTSEPVKPVQTHGGMDPKTRSQRVELHAAAPFRVIRGYQKELVPLIRRTLFHGGEADRSAVTNPVSG